MKAVAKGEVESMKLQNKHMAEKSFSHRISVPSRNLRMRSFKEPLRLNLKALSEDVQNHSKHLKSY